MNNSVNNIFLRRKNKVCLPYTSNVEQQIPDNYLVAMLKNIAGLGYMFTERLIEQLKCLPVEFVETFYLETITTLKAMKGVETYEPMYPNFPKQVAEAHELELFFNAIVHYWTLARPAYEKNERLPLFEDIQVIAIGLGSEEEIFKIFNNIMSSNSSISATDRKDLAWLFENNLTLIAPWVPEAMPNKEVLAYTAGLVAKHDPSNKSGIMGRMFKTATDVLRFLTALSDGDVSLSENTKFRKFSRPERRMVMTLLNQFPEHDRLENMQQHRERWLRVGEVVHPGEYKAYPKVLAAFEALRANKRTETFNSKLEAHIQNKDYSKAIKLLVTRPGIFARRLDEMFRTFSDHYEETLTHFGSIADKVATTVLIQLISHMKGRANTPDLRVFVPKGSVAKTQIFNKKFPDLLPGLTAQVVLTCEGALRRKFSQLPEMGSVYVDQSLRDYTIPFGQRSASEALRVIPKGSRMKLSPEKNTIRMFIWWKNTKDSRVDLDLSTIFYSDGWKELGHVSYTRLRASSHETYHSGDITDAPGPNGACEFIDIDIPSNLRAGTRYVLMNVYSFTCIPFSRIDWLAGWMSRESVNSGEIFDPKTVDHRFTLAAEAKICIPVVFDLQERKAIWLDLVLTHTLAKGGNNVESNKPNMVRMAKATVERSYYNLGELFTQHVRARNGIFVDKPEDADIILTSGDYTPTKEQRVITPFDTEVILAEYLQ